MRAPIAIDDHWERDFSPTPKKFDLIRRALTDDWDFALGAGPTKLRSTSHLTARRLNGLIRIQGVVEHVWKDDYDFTKDALPLGLSGRGWLLEKTGRDIPFRFGATWRQRLSVTLKVENGDLNITSVKWEDL